MVPFPLFSQRFVTMMVYEGHGDFHFISVLYSSKLVEFSISAIVKKTEAFSMVLTILQLFET